MLNGLFAKIQYPVGVDYLSDAMTGVRFSSSSFERWGDKNHLKGRDGKTIRLRWLSAKGINLDTFAADFMREHDNLFADESQVIDYVVGIIVQYPSGTNAYFKERLAEIEAENDSLNTRAAKAHKDELDENELANELFESKIKSGTKTKVKRKLVSKQRFTKEYLLLKRLVSFNNKRVDVTQLNKFSIDAHVALKGKTNHGSLLKKAVSRVDLLLFKLDGVKTVKKLEVSKDLLEAATKIVTQPKVRSVELGVVKNRAKSIQVEHKKKASLGELLFGVDFYTKAEAAELGLLDGSLAGTGKPRNPYDVVNRIIINQLDKGVVPWEMPWTMDKGKSVAPQNYGSKRDYRGINFWNLICEMDMRNHEVPYFLTSKQVADKGGKIAKGSKPYYVTYYGKFNVTETEIDKETGDAETLEKAIRFLKLYAVYNIEDTDLQFDKPDNKPAKEVERIASAEAILEGMPKKPKIKFGGNQAFYSPSQDLVQMPKAENFKQIDRYYSTFFHELVHSTKDDKRCGTDHFRKNSKAFGDKQYSWEELVAELGASYLCSEAGILHKTVGQSAAYIKGWAKSLQQYIKEDKTYFFKAANYAQKAADFILNKQQPPKEKLPPVKASTVSKATTGKKIGLKNLTIHWAEGNQSKFDKFPKKYKTWELAHKATIAIYNDATQDDTDSYNKVKFTATFNDGETYEGRLDVSKKYDNPTKTNNVFGLHIVEFLDFEANKSTSTNAEDRKEIIDWLRKYDLGIDIPSTLQGLKNKKVRTSRIKGFGNSIGGVDEIIKIVKEVYPEAEVKEIKLRHPFTNMDKLQSGGTYQLKGELGKFLGNLGEVDCSITIRGDQGAGKSQLMWQLIDAFASIGKRVAVASPEMSGNSPTISKYRDQFISPENQSKILFTDQKLTVQELKDFADMYDVLFVDSFNQLKDYQQNQFESLSKQLPKKCIVGLFQSTTGGEMRGGNKPEFDAYVNIEVNKVDDSFVNNYAVCTKNRFGGTGLKYNISKRKIVK